MDETLNEIQSKTYPRDCTKFDHNMQPGMIEEIMVKGHKPAKIK